MLRAYEGKEPYIFISYSHRNKDVVLLVIEALQNSGYNVWFDAGIEAGSEWPEYIANHLSNCDCVLSFISNDFARSSNCRQELVFARENNKPILNVYIEETKLSPGLRMQLCLNQTLDKKNFPTMEAFCDEIIRARIIQDCKAKPQSAPPAPPVETPAASEPEVIETVTHKTVVLDDAEPVRKKTKAPEKKAAPAAAAPKAKDIGSAMPHVGWTVCLLELSYCVTAPMLMKAMTGNGVGGWMVFFAVAALHLGMAFLNYFLLRFPSKKMKDNSFRDYAFYLLILCVLTSVVSVITGCFNIMYEINVFLKILLSLGLQIVPTVCSSFVYFALIGTGPKR